MEGKKLVSFNILHESILQMDSNQIFESMKELEENIGEYHLSVLFEYSNLSECKTYFG